MYLWNAYAGYRAKRFGTISGTFGENGNTTVKRFGGTTASEQYDPFRDLSVPSSSSTAKFIWVGTGTTEPTLLDYSIPNKCAYSSSGMHVASVTNGSVEYDEKTNTYSKTSVELIKNAGSDPVTISEIYIVYSTTNFSNTNTVWYKKLLEKPITVESGKYLEITFTSKVKDGNIIDS